MGYNSSSWQHWGLRNTSSKLLSISYTKKRADTVLQAFLYTTMGERLFCSNWYLLFNDEHCTDPMPIYTSVVDFHGRVHKESLLSSHPTLSPAVLTGYCYGTSSGRFRSGSTIEVSANLEPCNPNYPGFNDAVTGMPFTIAHVTTTFVIQEICP